MRFALAFALALPLVACPTYRDDLQRGQTAFEQNNHERALALFRALEMDLSHLSFEERAHYMYLRGMTDYRIGYRADARHWLLLARAMEGETPGVLPKEWRTRTDEALTELNEIVYTRGVDALTNTREKAESDDQQPVKRSKKVKSEDEP